MKEMQGMILMEDKKSVRFTKVVRIDEDLVPVIQTYSDGSISDGIREMHKILSEKAGRRLVTPDQFKEAVRQVVQVEGVMLTEKQKGFFRDLFTALLKSLQMMGGERK